jgi:hypothetical protein
MGLIGSEVGSGCLTTSSELKIHFRAQDRQRFSSVLTERLEVLLAEPNVPTTSPMPSWLTHLWRAPLGNGQYCADDRLQESVDRVLDWSNGPAARYKGNILFFSGEACSSGSIKGNVKRKHFPAELRAGFVFASAFSPSGPTVRGPTVTSGFSTRKSCQFPSLASSELVSRSPEPHFRFHTARVFARCAHCRVVKRHVAETVA